MTSTLQLFADEFLESAGAIVFNSDKTQIVILYSSSKNEYLLPKGRRNVTESRAEAALREVKEETGYTCHLVPITMKTRAPPADEKGFTPDVAVERECMSDPFALTIREEEKRKRKIIWWFVAQVENDGTAMSMPSWFDAYFTPEWRSVEEAMQALTYQSDRELVARASTLVAPATNK